MTDPVISGATGKRTPLNKRLWRHLRWVPLLIALGMAWAGLSSPRAQNKGGMEASCQTFNEPGNIHGEQGFYMLNHFKNAPKRQRSAVLFPHDMHMEYFDCLGCHHKYENGENILYEEDLEEGNPDICCLNCHKPDHKVDPEQAFHRQCIGCHEKYRKKGETTGPVLCGSCHPRSHQTDWQND